MKTLRDYQKKAVTEAFNELIKSNDPVLLNACVGSGKSLMIAEIARFMEKKGKSVLCVVSNSELVRNNAKAHVEQGGDNGVFCSTLSRKENKNITFGSPQSIINAINKNHAIAKRKFSLIIIDECHLVNHKDSRNTFMRILRHYKQLHKDMRVLGCTGTPFRYKGEEIVGDECLFKKQVGDITIEYLLSVGYLTKPIFSVDKKYQIDFSELKTPKIGKFTKKQLSTAVNKDFRKTGAIMMQLSHIMESQNRFGAFIFAVSKEHCDECMRHLPADKYAVITGTTPDKKRNEILSKARKGEIKYLVNINVLATGVDVPQFDTICFVRPTESLVLMVQMIGRGLRLNEGKKDCLVLDCAGNIERHQDWDNPVLLEAVKQTRDKDKELIFECYECGTMNSEYARRCVGTKNDKRCDFYFNFKECQKCHAQNDITSRHCRVCNAEIIDPNKKLSLDVFGKKYKETKVLAARYWITDGANASPVVRACYKCDNGKLIYETFATSSERARNLLYVKFIKKHVKKTPSMYYPVMNSRAHMNHMLKNIVSPEKLYIDDTSNKIVIKEKLFPVFQEDESQQLAEA